MSARRLAIALGLALAAGAAFARPAHAATDSIVVQVAGQLAARAGQTISVPVTVDMRAAPGRTLGGYTLALNFDTATFYYYGDSAGNFAAPLVNSDSVGRGQLRYTAVLPAGATGLITLFSVQLYVKADTLVSAITVTPTQLTAAAGSITPFEDLLPITKVVNGTFCRSLGTWGDVDGDGQENSRDALAALSQVVGMPLDTTLLTPALADVDGDGKVTSRDALIILSSAVGLPVSGYRIGQVAAGACATGNATALAILPDSLELSAGQTVPIVVQATDASGRVVPIPGLTWTSTNTSVAMFASTYLNAPPAGSAPARFGGRANSYYGAGIEARGAGVATITATMAPGVSAQIKVVVLAHRTTWYVDVRRASNAPTQAGSAAFPFAFIGDAADPTVAGNGDTVLVAGGEYDELVSSAISLVIRGDSTDRPVIDQRGSPSYSAYSTTVSLGSAAGPTELSHAIVRGGGVYLQGHDITVRDVAIQMLGGTSTGLEISSEPASGLGTAPGNVLVDHVTSDGAPLDGILIDRADTAVVTNNTVARDSTYGSTCGVGSGSYSGIGIGAASASVVQGNTVTDATCAGITVYQTAGAARISRNTILRPAGAGIVANAPVVATDHNVIRAVASLPGNTYQSAYGIYVDITTPVDSASSRADSVVGVHGYYSYAGFYAGGATVVAVDSLVADSIGDSGTSYYGSGVQVFGTRITVSRSRLTHLVGSGIEAGSAGFEFLSQGNVIANAQGSGIQFTTNCDCSPAPDSARSVGDSIRFIGNYAIDFPYANVFLVQNAVIDSVGGNGVYFYHYTGSHGGAVTGSKISRSGTGISISGLGAVQIANDSLVNNGTGLYVYSLSDTVRTTGTIVGGGGTGLAFYYAPFTVDSSAVSNAGTGMYVDGGFGGYVTRSRFSADSNGIAIGPAGNVNVTGSNFEGNRYALVNGRSDTLVTLFAEGNWWNGASGPTCDTSLASHFGGCTGNGTAADSITGIVSYGLFIDYANYLGSAAPTPAPRAFATALARRASPLMTAPPAPGSAGAARVGGPAARVHAPPPPTPAARQVAPRGRHTFPPAWQRGRERQTTRTVP